MEPLRVTATLDAPVAFHAPIHFDALLAAAVALRDNIPPAAHDGELVDVAIPVQRSACGRYYLASVGHCDVEAHELKHINRRFPLEQMQWIGDGKTSRVNLSAGPQKMYRIPMPAMHLKSDKITWWCVGERGAVEELLRLVVGLGRKRSVGLGAVRSWLVESCEPWPGFPVLSADGDALRNLPLDAPGLKTFALDVQRVEPPFWLFAGRTECAVPVRR